MAICFQIDSSFEDECFPTQPVDSNFLERLSYFVHVKVGVEVWMRMD